jgi:hypothetical protein
MMRIVDISGRLIISQIIVGSTKDSDHLFAISPCARRTSRSNSIKTSSDNIWGCSETEQVEETGAQLFAGGE